MNTGALFPGHVIIPEDVFRKMQQELSQLKNNYKYVSQRLEEASDVCDEWEKRNGDAPHSSVDLADRIRVNAGLLPKGKTEVQK